jgi:hypothetical protein
MAAVQLWIPIETKSTANLREHWSKRARRVANERRTVEAMWRSVEQRAMRNIVQGKRVRSVGFVRVGKRLLDSDNLGGALKAVRDEIARQLGIDDGPTTGIAWRYAQSTGREVGVLVEIEVSDV